MIVMLVQVIDKAVLLYSLIIIARAFLPLIGADTLNPVVRFIYDVTEPVLAPLRRYTVIGMWDLSPLAALIILTVVEQALTALLLYAFR